MQAVLDAAVLISALLAPHGAPARIVRAWLDGAFDLIVSPLLLDEVERGLAYPKLRARIDANEAQDFVEILSRSAVVVDDPSAPASVASTDANDNYLIALASATAAPIISGDHHLLDLAPKIPVYRPAEFLELLDELP